MKNLIRKNKNIIVSFILGAILFSGVGVYAAVTFAASDVTYTPSDTSWSVTKVDKALDQLYSKSIKYTDATSKLSKYYINYTCPGCVYTYVTFMRQYGTNGTILTSDQYEEDWENVVRSTGKPRFLGMILDNDNRIVRAFACGVNNEVPFCIEGSKDGSKYSDNHEILQSTLLYNGTCGSTYCSGSVNVTNASHGYILVNNSEGGCDVRTDGNFFCFNY